MSTVHNKQKKTLPSDFMTLHMKKEGEERRRRKDQENMKKRENTHPGYKLQNL